MKRFLIIILFTSKLMKAQKAGSESYMVYVNYSDYSVKAEVLSSSVNLKPKQQLEYHWYSSNKIFHTQGGCDGKILCGSYSSFYLSNNLKEKGAFKKGLKTGKWIGWFENGNINEISIWRNGLLDGEVLKYDDKGNLLSITRFKKGKIHGLQEMYFEGKLKEEKKFKHGKEIHKKERAKIKPIETNKEKRKGSSEKESIKETDTDHLIFSKMKSLFNRNKEKRNKLPKEQYLKQKDRKSIFQNKKKAENSENKK
jgi:antitoxin component YwqK of YwqJK toxin-antitoxin module